MKQHISQIYNTYVKIVCYGVRRKAKNRHETLNEKIIIQICYLHLANNLVIKFTGKEAENCSAKISFGNMFYAPIINEIGIDVWFINLD